MESSLSSDTEDEVFFGPILSKESRIASKLRRRTELYDPGFRDKRVASHSHSSDSQTETSLSDVFVEEPYTSTAKSPTPLTVSQSNVFKDDGSSIDSPLPRNVERTKSKDTADEQKESPFQMKGKALLDLIYKTKEEWSSPTQSPRSSGMRGSDTKSPMKRRIINPSISDSQVFCPEKVAKCGNESILHTNDVLKSGEHSMDNCRDFSENLSRMMTSSAGDKNEDKEMLNEDEINYSSNQSNSSVSKNAKFVRRNYTDISVCQNLSNAFEENSNVVQQLEGSCQQFDSGLDGSRQDKNGISRSGASWERRTERDMHENDSCDSSHSKDVEITVTDVSFASSAENEEGEKLSNSEAISSIQSCQLDSLESSVWSEYISEQDQIEEGKLDGQHKEDTTTEISAGQSCSACHDNSNGRDENSLHRGANENSLVDAPLSAFTKVSHQNTCVTGQISGASLKELSFKKFTPSMSSSPRASAFSSLRELSRKDVHVPKAVSLESGSLLQDSTNLIQQVDSPKYFPAITMVDIKKNESMQESCVSSPGPIQATTPFKIEGAYPCSPQMRQENQSTSLCQSNHQGVSAAIHYASSPQHQNVTKLQSDSPLQLRKLLEQKRTQLLKLKQAKEEMMQKITDENKHFSLQVENALALRRNMASLEDIQRSPVLRENISRLQTSPPECLDENSFDELTRFYTWKNSQQVISDGSPYNSPLAAKAINRKTDKPHLRWVENLVVDVTQLSSPSKPAPRRKSILLKRM